MALRKGGQITHSVEVEKSGDHKSQSSTGDASKHTQRDHQENLSMKTKRAAVPGH